jgi:hypothetical protein
MLSLVRLPRALHTGYPDLMVPAKPHGTIHAPVGFEFNRDITAIFGDGANAPVLVKNSLVTESNIAPASLFSSCGAKTQEKWSNNYLYVLTKNTSLFQHQ